MAARGWMGQTGRLGEFQSIGWDHPSVGTRSLLLMNDRRDEIDTESSFARNNGIVRGKRSGSHVLSPLAKYVKDGRAAAL